MAYQRIRDSAWRNLTFRDFCLLSVFIAAVVELAVSRADNHRARIRIVAMDGSSDTSMGASRLENRESGPRAGLLLLLVVSDGGVCRCSCLMLWRYAAIMATD